MRKSAEYRVTAALSYMATITCGFAYYCLDHAKGLERQQMVLFILCYAFFLLFCASITIPRVCRYTKDGNWGWLFEYRTYWIRIIANAFVVCMSMHYAVKTHPKADWFEMILPLFVSFLEVCICECFTHRFQNLMIENSSSEESREACAVKLIRSVFIIRMTIFGELFFGHLMVLTSFKSVENIILRICFSYECLIQFKGVISGMSALCDEIILADKIRRAEKRDRY